MKNIANYFEQGAARRILALALSFCMVFTMSPLITAAEAKELDGGETVLSSFAELPPNIREQSVPLGVSLDELKLPETLEATAYSVSEGTPPPAEPIAPSEPQDSGTVSTPSESEKSEATPPAEDTTPPMEETAPPATEEQPATDTSNEDEAQNEQTDATPPAQSDKPASKAKFKVKSIVPLAASFSDAENNEPEPTPPSGDVTIPAAVTVEGITWKSTPEFDSDTVDTYIFTAVLPSGYTVEDGIAMPVITVTVGEAEQPAVDKVIAMIDALPSYSELTADPPGDADPQYADWLAKTQQTLADIRAAKAAYDALSDDEKLLIDEVRTAKLLELAELAEQMAGIMLMADGTVEITQNTEISTIEDMMNALGATDGNVTLNGDTIVLQKDITLNFPVDALLSDTASALKLNGITFALDLNGHTLKMSNDTAGKYVDMFNINSGTIMTLKDSVGGGFIQAAEIANPAFYIVIVQDRSHFIMESGKLRSNEGMGIRTSAPGKVTINGGEIRTKYSCVVSNQGTDRSTINITGGTFVSKTGVCLFLASPIDAFISGTPEITSEGNHAISIQNVNITIKGNPKVTAGSSSNGGSAIVTNDKDNAYVSIYGGTFTGGNSTGKVGSSITGQYSRGLFWGNAKEIKVYGGTFIAGTGSDGVSTHAIYKNAAPVSDMLPTDDAGTGNPYIFKDSAGDDLYGGGKFPTVSETDATLVSPVQVGPKNDPTILDLKVDGCTLSPEYDKNTAAYTATVANSVDKVGITPILSDTKSTMTIQNSDSGTPIELTNNTRYEQSLNVGENKIMIKVDAKNNKGEITASMTYTLTITRETPPGYAVTITPHRDGAAWTGSGKSYKLTSDSGSTFTTDLSAVKNGTYAIYETDGTNTGITITVAGAVATATVDYYIVSFYDGGTAYTTPTPQEVLKTNGRVTVPTAPAKTGYTFYGWKTTNGGTIAFDFADTAITAATSIYASWTPVAATAPTISSHPADATVTVGSVSGSLSMTASVASGHTLAYQWYSNTINTNSGGSSISGATGASFAIPAGLTKGTYYYYCVVTATRRDNVQTASTTSNTAAVTARLGIAVTFNSNGGSVISDFNGFSGGKVTKPGDSTKTGYSFAGWFKESSLVNGWNFDSDTLGDSTITLYAKWTSKTDTAYQIEYYQQNIIGSNYTKVSADTESKTGTTGATASVAPVADKYTGFTYNAGAAGTTLGGPIAADGSLMLKVYYDRTTYTVSFNSKNGSAVDSITGVRHGSAITAPPAPTRTGYAFDGWYKEAGCTNAWTFATDTISEAVTLYAKWTDTAAPTITATASTVPSSGWFNANTNIALTYSDNEGVAALAVSVDGAAYVPISSFTASPYAYAVSNEGEHTYKFKATDTANLSAESDTITVTLDKTAPTGVSISYEAINTNGFAGFMRTITFDNFFKEKVKVTVTVADATSGAAGGKLDYKAVNNSTDETAPSGGWTTAVLDRNGQFSFEVNPDFRGLVWAKGYDMAGNPSGWTSKDLTTEQTPPTLALSGNAPDDNWKKTNVTFAVTASDGSGIDTVTASDTLSGSTPGVTDNGNGTYTVTVSPNGTHGVTVTAADKAGNTASLPEYTIKIDKTAPTIAEGNVITRSTEGKLTFTVTPSDGTDASGMTGGNAKVEYSTNNSTWQTAINNGDGSYTFELTSVSGDLYIKATDAVGNEGAAYHKTGVVLESTKPVVTFSNANLTAAEGGWLTTAQPFTVTADDKPTGVTVSSGLASLTVEVLHYEGGVYEKDNSLSKAYTDLTGTSKTADSISPTDGRWKVIATATDQNSNTTTETRFVKLDTGAPTLSGVIAANITDKTADLQFTTTEAGGWYYLLDPTSVPAKGEVAASDKTGAATSGQNSIPLGNLTSGTKHIVYVVVKDEADNISEVQKIEFATKQTAPTADKLEIGYVDETYTLQDGVELFSDLECTLPMNGGSLTNSFGDTVYIRYPEKTDGGMTIPASGATPITIPTRSSAPAVPTIHYANETAAMADNLVYSIEPSGTSAPAYEETSNGSAISITAQIAANGTTTNTIYLHKPASEAGKQFASEGASKEIPMRPAAPAPGKTDETYPDADNGKLTGLTAGTAYKISSDGGTTWKDAALTGTEIPNLAAGSYMVQIKATDSRFRSEASSTVTIGTTASQKETTPTAVFEAAENILSDIADDMQYSLDGGATWKDIGAVTSITVTDPINIISDILIKRLGNGTTTVDSDHQKIELTKAATPVVDKTDETAMDAKDGTLTQVSAAMEYQKSGEARWTAITGTAVTGLAPGIYFVRVKGAGTVLASDPAGPLVIRAFGVTVIPVTGVTITPAEKTIKAGDTAQLTAVVVPSDATNKAVHFSSDKPDVATVNATGLVTANATGTARITVTTVDDQKTAFCTIIVPETGAIDGTVRDKDGPVKDAAVTVHWGGTTGELVGGPIHTGTDGNFSFTALPRGTYSLVVKRTQGGNEQTITKKIEVAGITANGDIFMPEGERNTVVEVNGKDTPSVAVEGLDSLFKPENQATEDTKGVTAADAAKVTAGGSVEIILTAEMKQSAEVSDDATKIQSAAGNKKEIGLLLDLSVFKAVTASGGTAEPTVKLTELPALMEIAIPISGKLQGKEGLAVLRVHNGTVQTLPTSSGSGEYYTVTGNSIILHVQKFSTYAVVNDKTSETPTPDPDPTPPPSGGGGGSSYDAYTITATAHEGGEISPSGRVKVAKYSDKTFTITPDEGWMLEKVLIDGKREVTLTNDKYTFKTVTDPYTIDAYFVKSDVPVIPDAGNKTNPETGGTDGTFPEKTTDQGDKNAGGGIISNSEGGTETIEGETADKPLKDDSEKNTPEKDAPVIAQPDDTDRTEPTDSTDNDERSFVLLSALFALAGLAFAVLTAVKKKSRKRKISSVAAAIGAVVVFLLTTGWSGFALANWWTLLVAAFTVVTAFCMGVANKNAAHAEDAAVK